MENWLLVLAAVAAVYMIPSGIGLLRGVERIGGVVVVNVFLGWTFLGWIGALVRACVGRPTIERIEQRQKTRAEFARVDEERRRRR